MSNKCNKGNHTSIPSMVVNADTSLPGGNPRVGFYVHTQNLRSWINPPPFNDVRQADKLCVSACIHASRCHRL